MSLSLRGLLIAFPVVALIIGGMALLTYRSAISDFRTDATSELVAANDATAGRLAEQLDLVANIESEASAIMRQRLLAGRATSFENVFVPAPDGAFHSRDILWDGAELAGSVRMRGFGAFVASRPQGERRDTVMAAFDTIKTMAGGLPDSVESLYFFSPANDLLIFAPTREDELEFYRQAPADFDFQDAEFSQITSPEENPAGELRCTSLQQPIYDDTGANWTTGCMLPFRIGGRHLGAWGISIPLRNLTQSLQEPPAGATTIIASLEGKLIHHSSLTENSSGALAANVDLAESDDPMLRGLVEYLDRGDDRQVEYSDALGAYISSDRLEAPDWVVFTILPEEALSARAWSIAQRVILVAFVGALLLGLILTALFHRTVARRISRLADRTDRIAGAGNDSRVETRGDEIAQLEVAFGQMEERLRQARSRESRSFDALVDAAKGYAMVLYDRHGSVVRSNEGANLLFGADAIEGLGKEAGLSAEGVPESQSGVRRRKLDDGQEAWIDETIVPLVDDAGDTFGAAYIAHDLTKLHTAQREAENSLLYLEMAQSSAQAGHFALDPETMVVTVSPWLEERLGIAGTSLHLSEVPALIDPDHRDQTMADIAQAIERKSDFAFETVAIGSDGKPFPAMLRGATVYDETSDAEQPRLVGYYGILQDVSDQKANAEALLQALDEAKAEARARSDLLAVISHEVRTPISGILGLIDQIRRERSDTERSRALSLIEDSSNVLLETLDATLNRTKNEQDRLEEKAEEFTPSTLVERAADLFRPLARRKGLSIDIDIETASREAVLGRPGRIQQILANFLSNAIKFTSTGRIALACAPAVDQTDIWTFSVTDTGAGISPERMKTIFEPFAGTSPDTLGRNSGSGLGLSITRQLATELGGHVRAEAAEGKGTRMILEVPLDSALSKDEPISKRGTIFIDLKQASLGVRAEAIAESCGFAVCNELQAEEADIAVSDDRNLLAAHQAELRILVGDQTSHPPEEGYVVIAPGELATRLAGILQGDDNV